MRSRPPNPKQPKLNLPKPASYEVGYGKPPAQNKFKPGESGNPRGRPRGAKNKHPGILEERLKDIVLNEAYRTVKLKEGEKNITLPIAQAVVRTLAVAAVKGNTKAAQQLLELIQGTERANAARALDTLQAAVTYKATWELELEMRQRNKLRGVTPMPHPDDVRINEAKGDVQIIGPTSRRDIPYWEELKERKLASDYEFESFVRDLQFEENLEIRLMIQGDIAYEKNIHKILCRIIPD